MDEKTEELRDIFIDVTDEDTVTESQEETPGSLASEEEVENRLRDVVARMREEVGFATSFDDAELVEVVRGFYAGETDADIARRIGNDSLAKKVARARVDLHLIRDADTDAPFDFERFRRAVESGEGTGDLAEALSVSESTVRRYRSVVEAQRERRRVGDRYTDEFENVLQDRELTERMTENVQQDGLEEATEGQETDVDL